MIERPFWQKRIEKAWDEAPVVWLAGVRRSGKTTLAQSLDSDRIHYLNCDLPVVSDMVADPELFYRNCNRSIVVFDEIHQLLKATLRCHPFSIRRFEPSLAAKLLEGRKKDDAVDEKCRVRTLRDF